MSPIPHQSYRPTPEIITLLPPSSWDGMEGRNGSTLPQVYENIPAPQTITETVPVLFTVTEVQTLTVTARVTTTNNVAATTIFIPPPRPSQLLQSVSPSTPSTTSSLQLVFPTSSSTSSFQSVSPTSSSTTSSLQLVPNSSPPLSSSTASTSSSTLDKFPPFPTGPAPTTLPIQTGSKLSSGGIVGIILSCVLFVALLGVCFMRLRSTRKREKDRTWVTPFIEAKPAVRVSVKQRQDKRTEAFAERWERLRRRNCRLERQSNNRGAASEAANVSTGDRNHSPTGSRRHQGHDRRRQLPAPPVPPQNGLRRGPSSPPPVYREPSARRPVQDDMLASSLFPHGAVAKLHFHPIRPDELEVHPGDYLRVIALFDDGWAQCKAITGRRGMVPTTCLRINDVRRIVR